MAVENEVGKVALGIELATDSIASQGKKLEEAVSQAAGKAGKKGGEKLSEETAKGIEKGIPQAEKAGEKTGEKAGEAARKALHRNSGKISKTAGEAGEKAGRQFQDGFDKTASGGFGGFAKKITGMLVKAFAAKKIFDFSKKAIDLGSDLAEVQNVVDSTFGAGSEAQKAVNDFAQNAAAQFGLSETMAKRYAGTFGAMSRAFGFASNDAAEMSTRLAGLAGDVASFYNITQDEAYTKLKSVFTGETESLKELGVVMTQAALDQYALQSGFGRTTKYMTEQEKVALRYRFVLDKLATASGDFSRTSGSWANQVRLLKLQFESLAATIGQALIAALTPAIKALNNFMGALIKAANTFKAFIFSLFGLQSQDMGTGSGSPLPEAMGNIGNSADDAADSLGNMGDAAKGAGKDASKAADEINRSLASFDKITKLTDSSSSGSGGGGSGGSGGSGGGGGGGASLGDTSSALTNTAYDVAGSNGPLDKILDKLKALKDLFVGGFWEGFGDIGVLDSIKDNLENIRKTLKEIFTDPAVVNAANEWADKIAENLGKVVGSIASIGATIADNLTGGFSRYLDQHKEDIKKYIISVFNVTGEIADIIGNFAASFADVFSVFRSDKAKQITADIIDIFATGFGTVLETALKFARDVTDNITKPFIENKDKIKQALEGTIGQIETVLSGVAETVHTVSETVEKVYDEHIKPLLDSLGDGLSEILGVALDAWEKHVRPVLDELANKFKDVLENHVNPMIESAGEALGGVIDILKELWDNVLKPLIKWITENIMPVIGDMAEILGETLLEAIKTIADNCKDFSDGIKTAADWIKKLIDWTKQVDFSKIANGIKTVKDGAKNLPSKISLTAKAVVDKGWNSVVSAFDKLKNTTVVKTVKAKVEKTFSDLKKAWEAIKSGSVLKTAKGKAEKAFTDIKNAWAAIKSGTATKTIKGVKDKAWNSVSKAYTDIKNSTAVKTIKGIAEDTFSTIQKAWSTIKDGSALKRVKAQAESGWDSVVDKWGQLKDQTVKVIASVTGSVKDLWAWWKEKRPTTWTIPALVKGSMSGLWDWWRNKKPNWTITALVKGSMSGLWSWWSSHKPTSWGITALVKGSMSGLWSWWSSHKPTSWSITALVKGSTAGLWAWWNSHKPKLSDLVAKIKLHAPKIRLNWATKSFGPLGSIKYPTGFQVYARGGIFDKATVFGMTGNTAHIAGEDGKEAILPLDRHTEWMDKVAKRVIAQQQNSGMIDTAAYLPRLIDVSNGIRNETAQLVQMARQAEAASSGGNTGEMLDILRKILKLLEEKDWDIYIDGQKVTSRIAAIINQQTRATGRSVIIV